jgi:hypothetical protein
MVSLGLLMPMAVHASNVKNPYHLITSPVVINTAIQPGKSYSTDLKVKNDEPTPQSLRLTLVKMEAGDDLGNPVLSEFSSSDELPSWVSLSESEFSVLPGEWKTIKMTITLPTTAAFGYYYAVRFTPSEKAKSIGGEATLAGSNAVLVLVDAVSPNAQRKVDLVDFRANKGLFEYLPADFSAKFHNTGNVHVAPIGNIFITRGKSPVATLDFNSVGGNILPGSNRTYDDLWSDGFPVFEKYDEGGKQKTRLKWDFSQLAKIRFGQYTANLVAVYQDNHGRDVPVEASVTFWVIPWKVLGLLIFILIFIPVGIYATGRKLYSTVKRPKKDV